MRKHVHYLTRNWSRRTHNLLVMKLALSVGFLLLLALPHEWKEWSMTSLSLLWLWKANGG